MLQVKFPAVGSLGATGCVPETETNKTITTSGKAGREETPERKSEPVNDGKPGW